MDQVTFQTGNFQLQNVLAEKSESGGKNKSVLDSHFAAGKTKHAHGRFKGFGG